MQLVEQTRRTKSKSSSSFCFLLTIAQGVDLKWSEAGRQTVEHLKTCDDKKAIAAYKKKAAKEKERAKRKEKAVETQEDVMAFKTWEHNGRQVCVPSKKQS